MDLFSDEGGFELLAERASGFMARPRGFLALLAGFALLLALTDLTTTSAGIGLVTLFVVVFLHNRDRRTGEGIQHKLNTLVEGLGNLLDHIDDEESDHLSGHAGRLKEAVGTEEV